jgi:Protein of unknown function DUF262
MEEQKSKLENQIEKAQKLVRTDSLQMAVGELATMYESSELIVNPEFQRLFRWELEQKARLIESMLLGIPIPSIFVFERNDGTWELIDGLQRISTIFEFMGILNDPDSGKKRVPSALISTKYLPALNNIVWAKNSEIKDPVVKDQIEIEKKFQLAIRRARINVQILKRPSDVNTKFELFQRLNAGGTQANAQELRNSIVIMLDPDFNKLMRSMADNANFRSVVSLNSDAVEKQKDMEYISRFMVYTYVKYDGTLDIEEYIDHGLMELIKTGDRAEMLSTFEGVFKLLKEAAGTDALRRYDGNKFTGKIGYTAFEMIAVGVAKNINFVGSVAKPKAFVLKRIKALWHDKQPEQLVYAGMRGTTRIARTIPAGDEWFSHD